MTTTARVTIDPSRSSLAHTIGVAARGDALMVLTGHLLGDLADELGGDDAAMQFLLAVSTTANRPIGINVLTGDGASTTTFIAPRSWSRERLRGWIGAKRDELDALFGECTLGREEARMPNFMREGGETVGVHARNPRGTGTRVTLAPSWVTLSPATCIWCKKDLPVEATVTRWGGPVCGGCIPIHRAPDGETGDQQLPCATCARLGWSR